MPSVCPNCGNKVLRKQVKSVRRVGLITQRQCSNCEHWFQLETRMEILKNIGLLLLLICSLVNILQMKTSPSLELLWPFLATIGAFISVFAIFKGKLVSVEESRASSSG